jgi:hypothetical protein
MIETRDLTTRYETMSGDRAGWEGVWREINDVMFPNGPRMDNMSSTQARTTNDVWREPVSARRSRRMYDATGAISLDRAVAGVESMITPQAQQWHELSFGDPNAPAPTLEEEKWLDSLTEYLFRMRYDPSSGWLLSHQRALASTLALGTGVYYVEEAFGTRSKTEAQIPMRYQPIPLDEAHLDCNEWGEHNVMLRMFQLTAIQAYERFGDRNSPTLIQHAKDPARMDKFFPFLHAVMPTEQLRGAMTDQPFVSVYMDYNNRTIVSEGGFYEFPFVVYTWTLPSQSAYGESPGMIALPELKSLQLMSRDSLLASQLSIRPPVGTAFELDRPVNLNPGAINPKAVDPNTGRSLIQPIVQAGDPRLFEATMELRRQHVRAALFTDLFNVLVNKPNMSATEAMIRNQEKGELLGPAASRIQVGLSRCVDRELGILARKGAFERGSMIAPPDSIRGRDVSVKFSSPIDRARQMSEVTGMQQTLEFSAGIGQFNPEVFDNFDADAMVTRARYLLGAPPIAMKDPKVVQQMREAKANAAAQQAQMASASQAVDTMGGLGPAAEGMQAMGDVMAQAGINPGAAGVAQSVG